MNIKTRLDRLEEQANPRIPCDCVKHTLFEKRDMTSDAPAQNYSDDPIYCDVCGKERQRIILQLVDHDYVAKERAGVLNATFNIDTRSA